MFVCRCWCGMFVVRVLARSPVRCCIWRWGGVSHWRGAGAGVHAGADPFFVICVRRLVCMFASSVFVIVHVRCVCGRCLTRCSCGCWAIRRTLLACWCCCRVHCLIRSLVVRPFGVVVLDGVGVGVGVGMFVVVVGIVLALAMVHSLVYSLALLVGPPALLLFVLSWLCWQVCSRTGWRRCCCCDCCRCCARCGVVVGLVLSSSMS